MKRFVLILAAVAAFDLLAQVASATVYYPTNDGFETPDKGTTEPWECDVPNWTKTGWGGIAINNGDWPMLGATNYNHNGGATSTRGQGYWMNDGASNIGSLTSDPFNIDAGSYAVQFDIEQRYTNTANGSVKVEVLDSNSVTHDLGIISNTAGLLSVFEARSTGFVSLPAGMTQVIFSTRGVGVDRTIFLDSVRLSTDPIPEPGTITLIVSGLIGLLAYAWRKRK